MADMAPGSSLMQGDFLDVVVESAMHGMVSHLKKEYRKELARALEAANKDRTAKSECPTITVKQPEQPTEADVAPEGVAAAAAAAADPATALRSVAQAETPQEQMAQEHPHVVATSPRPGSGDGDGVECIRLSAERVLHEQRTDGGDALAVPGAVPDSCSRNSSRNNSKASNRSNKRKLQLSDKMRFETDDEEALKMIREAKANEHRMAQARFANKDARGSTFANLQADEEAHWTKKAALWLVGTQKFDFAMGLVIMFNALTIGLETSHSREMETIPTYLHVLEYSFLVIYMIELGLRMYAVGARMALSSNWVKFDAIMVVAGMLNFMLTVTSLGGDTAASVVDNINMLKMVRLFRLARTVRVLVQFRTLWMLVQGLMYAVLPMLWTALLMIVVIYVFAVIGMETIVSSSRQSDIYNGAASNFDNIGDAMVFLMQFMTLDSVASVYRPLLSGTPVLVIYFLVFLLLGPIALMNIVTAIMVESSLRTANEDQEAKKAWEAMRKKNMMPKLRYIFESLDADGNEEVDLDELMGAPDEVKEQIKRIVDLDEMREIFNLLDYDGSGSISIDEFVDGIFKSQADKPSELIVLVKQSRDILDRVNQLKGGIHGIAKAAEEMPAARFQEMVQVASKGPEPPLTENQFDTRPLMRRGSQSSRPSDKAMIAAGLET